MHRPIESRARQASSNAVLKLVIMPREHRCPGNAEKLDNRKMTALTANSQS